MILGKETHTYISVIFQGTGKWVSAAYKVSFTNGVNLFCKCNDCSDQSI